MKYHPNNFIKLFFAVSFTLLTLTASAQFNKPITSPRDQIQSSEAKWNVGFFGGVNLTTWPHFHSLESYDWYVKNYNLFDTITNSMGYFGGIAVERKIKSDISIGLNVAYAQHNIQLGFVEESFPLEWDDEQGQINFGRIEKGFKANYRAIEAYLPLTYYIGLATKKNVVPYVYVAPRFSYVLNDSLATMTHTAAYYRNDEDKTLISYSSNTVPFNRSTYRTFNVGATLGLGSLFRINAGNYYFLVKLDVSANMNGLPTYKNGEVVNDEFKYLRFSTDAHATLTLLLPLKKQLQGACMKWGEYD